MNATAKQEQAAVEVADEVVDRAEIRPGGGVLVEFSRTEAALAALTERYQGKTYDMTTTAGDKEARAARLELVATRTALEAKRKELKAPAIEFGKQIDVAAARIAAAIKSLEDPIDAQIKADEARREAEREAKRKAEAERVAKHEDGIAIIREYATRCANWKAADIANAIIVLEPVQTTEAEFEEFALTATRVKAETLSKLHELRQAALEREAEAARLAAEREAQRIEAERQRAEAERLAAERAQIEAAQAEIRRQQEELQRQQREAQEAAQRQQEAEAAEAKRKADEEAAAACYAAALAERDALARQVMAEKPVRETLAAPAAVPTLKLGDINTRLGFTLTADFLASLGYPATVERNARLFHESDWPAIKAALIAHIQKA